MTRSVFLNQLNRSEFKVVVVVVVVVVVMTGHYVIHTTVLPNVASQPHKKF